MVRYWTVLGMLVLAAGSALVFDRVAPGRVAVLMYHHLAPLSERPEEPGVITPERFESHLKLLQEEGYWVISAAEFSDYLDDRLPLPDRSVLITFDDGYASNYTLGYPLLQRYGVPALIFPVAKYFDTDGKGAWSPHLNAEQAAEMLSSGLVAFGGHSYDGHGFVQTGQEGRDNGPWLTTRAWLPQQQRVETEDEYRARIRADLVRTREVLQQIGVEEAVHFALPNGASTPGELEILRELSFRHLYSTDDTHANTSGVPLIYRVDAGSPLATSQWLRDRLAQLFGN